MNHYFFNVYEIIKAVRKIKAIKQAEFASLLGISQGNISKIENGKIENDLSFSLVVKFCDIFDIPITSMQNGLIIDSIPLEYQNSNSLFPGSDIGAKTLFFILENMKSSDQFDPYENLISRELLCFSKSRFSIDIIFKVYNEFPNQLFECLRKIQQSPILIQKHDVISISKAISSLKFIRVIERSQTKIKLQNTNDSQSDLRFNHCLANTTAFEVSLLTGVSFKYNNDFDNGYFTLDTV